MNYIISGEIFAYLSYFIVDVAIDAKNKQKLDKVRNGGLEDDEDEGSDNFIFRFIEFILVIMLNLHIKRVVRRFY